MTDRTAKTVNKADSGEEVACGGRCVGTALRGFIWMRSVSEMAPDQIKKGEERADCRLPRKSI